MREEAVVSSLTDAMPFLVLCGAAGALLLACGLGLAWRASRPRAKKPARKTFEAGRRIARMRGARTPEAALQALENAPVGKVERARATGDGYEIVVERKRSQSCAQTAGYLAGLFESAWARDVRVEHPVCAGDRGGVCSYHVKPSFSRAAPREAAGATRGSASATHRSPPARPGAG